MTAFRVLLLLAMMLAMTMESSGSSGSSWSSGSSGSSGSGNYHYTHSGQSLTDLYNSPVREAEVVTRPLIGNLKWPTHSGVRATLYDGSQWLIHKGLNYGLSGGDTIVTSASDMSNRWTAGEPVYFGGSKTIGDLVREGGKYYNLFGMNCHDARKRMISQ